MPDAVPSDLPATAAPPPPAQRTILRRAERVPLPRRLVAAALLFGVLAIVLNALPRPYKPVDTFFVLPDLGHAYADTRAAVASVDGQEELAGQAPPTERKAYRRELWMHEWIGITRELALRISVLLSALSLFGAVGLIVRRTRAEQRAMEAKGARLRPELLRTEAIEPPPPSPVIAPHAPAPLLPSEPPKSIVVETRPTIEPPREPPKEKPADEPAIDPALAKLGFQPRSRPDLEPERDDDDRPLPKNLARETTQTRESPAPSATAAPLPATTAELAFPIGFPGAGTPRPVVKPGTSKPPEDPEHTRAAADAERDTNEKTVTNPDAEKTVENPENTVTDEKSPGDKKPE